MIKNKPADNMLTILICCYNSAKFLKECLESLVCQNILDSMYKILFINDGSTDNSSEIVNFYSKKLKNLLILNKNKKEGLVRRCNQALKNIDTLYFMRLDADDYLSSDAVEKILRELNSPEKRDFIIFKRYDVYNSKLEEIKITNDIYTWIAAGTVFKTDAVSSVSGYSDEYWEEYDLYIKLIEAGYKYRISPHCIYSYRRGHKSLTQNCAAKKKGINSLANKWGIMTLDRFGNFKKFLEYYGA